MLIGLFTATFVAVLLTSGKATNYEIRSPDANENRRWAALRRVVIVRSLSLNPLPPLLFCSAPAEARPPVTAVSRRRAVVTHRRVKQAVSNPRKTAADDNKRLTDEEGSRTRSDDWTGGSSHRGGATPGAVGARIEKHRQDRLTRHLWTN